MSDPTPQLFELDPQSGLSPPAVNLDEPLRPRPRSFFRRVFLWILGMSLVMSVGSGVVFYTRQVKYIEADMQRRARSLLSSLASQSEIGAYAGDPGLLDLPVRRMAAEEDVVFAAIYDSGGRELLHHTDTGFPPPGMPPGVLQEVLKPSAGPLQVRDARAPYVDHYAQIITSTRDPALSAYSQPSDRVPGRDLVVGIVRIGLSLNPAKARLMEVLYWGVGLGLFVLAMGVAAAWFIAGKISVPILHLARGADEIRSGNLYPHIDVQRDDELGILAESFVRMTARLRETLAALEQLNRNLEAEVQRRTRQIQHAYEFTSVLNAPIDRRGTDPGRLDAADVSEVLDRALRALLEATGARGGGIFLREEDEPHLMALRACHGVGPHELTPPPDPTIWEPQVLQVERSAPRPRVEVQRGRLVMPLAFRDQPLGAVMVLYEPGLRPDHSVEDFVSQAAAQLSIAVSNARAYTRASQLAYELTERNVSLAEQRDQVKAQRDQLERQRDQLERQRDQLEQQRDQMELQSVQLRAQKDQLQEVNRLKSEFLASVSHELRTPLNAIMGYSELVSEEVYGPIPADAQEAMAGVLESSRNLLNLINQILDLARVEAGKMMTHVEDVDIHELVSAVAREADGMCKDRPYRVGVVCAQRAVVHTDRSRLQQILTNLVTNAIKFTAAGTVEIIVSSEGTDVLIAVRDTGIGIRPEHLSIIFEEFRQVDGSSTRRFGGTGLGLAIARRIAELLGATITVASEYGVGSTFTVRVPSGSGSRATAKMRALDASEAAGAGVQSEPAAEAKP